MPDVNRICGRDDCKVPVDHEHHDLVEENARLRRQLAQALRRDTFGDYLLGWWAHTVTHAEPCDCDLDEEVLGDSCGAASNARPALLQDRGGFAPTLVLILPPLWSADDDQDGQAGHYVAVSAHDLADALLPPPRNGALPPIAAARARLRAALEADRAAQV